MDFGCVLEEGSEIAETEEAMDKTGEVPAKLGYFLEITRKLSGNPCFVQINRQR